MLHELLLALHGHIGGVFVRAEGQVKVLQVPFLHPSEFGLLNRLCVVASHYCKFNDFLSAHSHRHFTGCAAPGFYMQALCNGLEHVLEPYVHTVLTLEQDLLEAPYLSLTHVQHALSEFQLLFPALSSLLDQITQRKAYGCQLLEMIHRECSSGDPVVQKAMLRIQTALHVTMYKQLSAWLLHGMLLDTHDEFFICHERKVKEENVSAVTTPRDEDATQASGASHTSCSTGPLSGGQSSMEASVGMDSTNDNFKYVLRIPMLPSYIPVSTASKILFVGESVLMLENDQRLTGGNLSRIAILRDKESEFSRAMHQLSKEEVFDISSFDRMIDKIRECVAERLWKLVVVDADLPAHLKLIKDFFLLGRGEVFQAFIDSAHWMLKGPPHSTMEHDINSTFQQAARSVLYEDEAALRQFSFSVASRGLMPAPALQARVESGWSMLSLCCSIQWPLHVLFTPLALERYNTLFKFLLLVRRTQLQLHGCWTQQMNRRHRKETSAEDSCRWQLRVHMAFLVDNLQYYLMADVIESHFAALLDETRTSRDFEAIQQAHDSFLTSLLAQSFLLMKPVANCIGEILDTCQSFCALVEQVNLELTADETAQLLAIRKDFQLQSSLLFRLLSSVRSHQIHPHLAQLLLRIDYNRYLSSSGGQLGGTST